MAIVNPKPTFILVGPENKAHSHDAEAGLAPRLDYRLLAEQIGATIVEGAPPPALLRGRRPFAICHSFLTNILLILRLLRRIPPGSLIFSTGETWGLPCGLVAALLRNRNFTHLIYVHRIYSRNWRWILHLLRPLLKVDGWICVNRNQRQALREILADDARIEVASQGVDTHFFDPELAHLSDSQDEPYILSIGAEMRDYPLLFDAITALDAPVVVKASSSWMKVARDEIGELPSNVTLITKRLTYVEMRDLYAAAALIVVPLQNTLQAAGITTILEAMAMRKCVIATQSAGLPDILVNSCTGFIVTPSAGQLSALLGDLLAAADKRDQIAACGCQAVRDEATIENYVTRIIASIRLFTSLD